MTKEDIAKAAIHRLGLVREWREFPVEPPLVRAFDATTHDWTFVLIGLPAVLTCRFESFILEFEGPRIDDTFVAACENQ